MKNQLLLIFAFLYCFGLFSCSEEVDWTESYDSNHKIPFGTYVLRNEMDGLFPDATITDIKTPTFAYFDEHQYDVHQEMYIFIYNYLPHPEVALSEISYFVETGGTAFLAQRNNQPFIKELGVEIEAIPWMSANKNALSLSVIKDNSEKNHDFEVIRTSNYFSTFNAETTEVLGYVYFDGKKEPNFLKVNFGEGYYLLHAEPIVFTNYYLLKKGQSPYVADVFSYAENYGILWDNQRINRVFSSGNNKGNFFSALDFFMKHPALKTAFLLLILLGLLYLLFNYKRRQRVLPILLPYENHTLNFSKTLAEVYRNHKDHQAIVRYKINYFLEQIRWRYQLTSKDFGEEFPKKLSAKSGVDLALCQALFQTIDTLQNKENCQKEDFYQLHALLTKFNQKSK